MTVPPQLTSSLPSFSYPASFRHPPPASSDKPLELGYIFYFWTTSVTFSPHGLHFSTKHSQNVQAILHCGGPLPGCVQYLAAVLEQILCPRGLPCIYDFYDNFSPLVFSLPSVFDFDILLSFFLDKLALQQLRGTFLGSDELIQTCGALFFSSIELREARTT